MTAVRSSPLPSKSFELSVVSVNQSGARLQACGQLDLAAAGSLSELLEREHTQGRRHVRLDLSRVNFLDALCLMVLLRAHHTFLAAHGLLILVGVGEHVEHLFQMADLDQTLFFTRSPEGESAVRLKPVRNTLSASTR